MSRSETSPTAPPSSGKSFGETADRNNDLSFDVPRNKSYEIAALFTSAAVVGLATILAVRPINNPFGFGWGLAITALLIWAGRRMSAAAAERTVMFLGVQCAANALYDLKTLVGLSTQIGAPTTDSVLMSQIIPLPPVVWALLWSAAALGILWATLRPYWRRSAPVPPSR